MPSFQVLALPSCESPIAFVSEELALSGFVQLFLLPGSVGTLPKKTALLPATCLDRTELITVTH